MAICPFDILFFYICNGSSELVWFLLRKVSLNLGRNREHFFFLLQSCFPDIHGVYRTRVHSGSQCCSAWPDLNPVLFCISQYSIQAIWTLAGIFKEGRVTLHKVPI